MARPLASRVARILTNGPSLCRFLLVVELIDVLIRTPQDKLSVGFGDSACKRLHRELLRRLFGGGLLHLPLLFRRIRSRLWNRVRRLLLGPHDELRPKNTGRGRRLGTSKILTKNG